MQSLITPRVNPCLVGTSLGLYALGGRIGDHSANIVEYYDPERDIWTNIRSMGKPRCYFGAVAVDDTIYAVEGMRDNLCILKSTEQFDPRTVTLKLLTSLKVVPLVGRLEFRLSQANERTYRLQLCAFQGQHLHHRRHLPSFRIHTGHRGHHTDSGSQNERLA